MVHLVHDSSANRYSSNMPWRDAGHMVSLSYINLKLRLNAPKVFFVYLSYYIFSAFPLNLLLFKPNFFLK